jgi:hypothetical protein
LQSAFFCRERRIGRESEMTEGVAFLSDISLHSPGGWETAHLGQGPNPCSESEGGAWRLGDKKLVEHVRKTVAGYSLNLVRNALSTVSVFAFERPSMKGLCLGGDE